MNIFLTKSTMPIIKYVALLIGYVMDGIYIVLDKIGIPNIGLAIVLFTILIYVLMIPLQVKQQKFSKMNSYMAPELKKIQNKYKDKKDQASLEKQNAETQAVYAKYGVSPTGSCLQLIIQMPILFALYQVIYKIPGYVGLVRNMFTGLVEQVQGVNGYTEVINQFITDNNVNRTLQLTFDEAGKITNESMVDFFYKLSPTQWEAFKNVDAIKGISGIDTLIQGTADKISHVNSWFGMSLSDTPSAIIASAFKGHSWGLLIMAALIPILAYVTQVLTVKLMPQPDMGNDSTASTMKTMNTMMPLMSGFFCLTLPVCIGIYWIAGAVVRGVETFFINKHLDNIDMDAIVEKNKEAAAQKMEKAKEIAAKRVDLNATRKTRTIASKAGGNVSKGDGAVNGVVYKDAKPGSLASKASLVAKYNEEHSKKK